MSFVIRRIEGFQKQAIAKTAARRKKNAAQVGLQSLTAHTPVNDMIPGIVISWRKPEEIKGPRRRVRKTEDRHLADTVRSIAQFGFVSPVIIRGDTLVDGYTRLMAARSLNLPRIPCIDVSHLDGEKVRLLGITLNRLAENGTWDTPELKLELAELHIADFDLTLTGFTMPEIDIILSDGAEEEHKKETIPEARGELAMAGKAMIELRRCFPDEPRELYIGTIANSRMADHIRDRNLSLFARLWDEMDYGALTQTALRG